MEFFEDGDFIDFDDDEEINIIIQDESMYITKEKVKIIIDYLNSILKRTDMNDYTKEKAFWERLQSFVSDIKTNCCTGEEEKQMILHNCNLKINETT